MAAIEFCYDMQAAPKDGTWVLLKGGCITYRWDSEEQPPIVVAQWSEKMADHTGKGGAWHFAWYDSGFLGEYENPVAWAPID
jgi:hypothetical protein